LAQRSRYGSLIGSGEGAIGCYYNEQIDELWIPPVQAPPLSSVGFIRR